MMTMATNLQEEEFNDGIEEVFERSRLDWLNQQDLVAIYDRHSHIPLPLSLIPLGPQPLEEGIFLYRSRRFKDEFEWDDVDEDRRKNCRSGRREAGAQVTHTEATLTRPEGDLFSRRNYHRGTNPFCVVHYMFRPAEDDVGAGGVAAAADEDDVDEAADGGGGDEAADDGGGDEADDDGGGEEAAEDGGDSDDADDPDYNPELEESDQVVSLCKRFKENALELKDPVRGVAPLLSAVHKAQAKCNKAGFSILSGDILEVCQPRDFVLYCYYGGMICIGLKRFQKASELLYNDMDLGLVKEAVASLYKQNMVQTADAKEAEMHVRQMIQDGQIHALINQKDGKVVTAPMYQVNAIAVDAYIKYILVNLIHSGQFSGSLPKCASTAAQRHLKSWCTAYYEVGNRYNDGKISELEAVLVPHSSDFEQDKDLGLVKQVLASLYKRNILGLTEKYLTLLLQDIVNMVQTVDAKKAHVLQMIQEGQIHALINQKDGMVRSLEDSEQYKTSEMIEVMDSVIQRTIGLTRNLLAMDESLSRDPMYLGKVGREGKGTTWETI